MSTSLLSPNVSVSFGGNNNAEMTSYEFQSTMLENISDTEIASQPLDWRVVRNKCDEACTSRPLSCQHQNLILNAPVLKDRSTLITEIKKFSSLTSNSEDLSNRKSPARPISQPMGIVTGDSSIQKSETKVAPKSCSKKSVNINLNIRSRSIASTNFRLQSLVKSLKNTMKSLAKKISLRKVISQICDSVTNKINGKRLQGCVEMLGFTFKSSKKRKRGKGSGKFSAQSASPTQKGARESTYINPTKKPELEHLAGFQFAKPKFYECSYCNTHFYKLKIYFRHIRRHAKIIRCDKCSEAFSSIINKRQHQLYCRQRIIV